MMVTADHLSKRYGDKVAVEDVSFTVASGQVYGFLGPNGAGKSTIIKMLTGLVHPTSGSGTVLGQPLGKVEARRKMGYLPEMFRYQEWMSGSDLLDFHTSLFKLKRDRSRNQRVLQRVGLSGSEKYKVGTYSKGMQQRLGLACALLPDPELLFLDEPTSALDPIGRKDVRDIILSLKREGTTVFLNSHLLSEVESVSDSVTIIHHGKVLRSGTTAELLAQKIALTVRLDEVTDEIIATLRQAFDCDPELQGDGRFVITLRSEDVIPEIVGALVQKGARVYELAPRRETLENVFLEAVAQEETR